MIRLTDLLLENMKENRINLVKLQTILEKTVPEMSASANKTLTEMFAEITVMALALNSIPYTGMGQRMVEWQFAIGALNSKLMEMRDEVVKLKESSETMDCCPLVNALDELLRQ